MLFVARNHSKYAGEAITDQSRLGFTDFGVPEGGIFAFAEFESASLTSKIADVVLSEGFLDGQVVEAGFGVGLTIGVGAGECFEWGSW